MKKTKDITLLAIMTSIIIIMFAIPGIGFIPVGPINATIVHIPVIILAIVRGPKMGAILGFIFGIASILNSLLRPTPASFIFINPIVAVLPRILIGYGAGIVANILKKKNTKYKLEFVIPSIVGSLINTIGVLGLIYILYGQRYLEATGKIGSSVISVIAYIALTNGVAEMIVSTLISVPVASALVKLEKRG